MIFFLLLFILFLGQAQLLFLSFIPLFDSVVVLVKPVAQCTQKNKSNNEANRDTNSRESLRCYLIETFIVET
jgi:hypothetical protein